MIKAILFDMDGTLMDSERAWAEAWSGAEEHFDFKFEEGVKESLIGMPKQEFEKIKDSIIPEHIGYAKVREFRIDYFFNKLNNKQIKVKTGANELIEFCKRNNIKCIVCTSAFEKYAFPILTSGDIIDCFDGITTGDKIIHGKPHPEIYLTCLKENKLSAEECIAVEDSSFGIKSSTSAGLKTYYIKDFKDIDDESRNLIEKQVDNLACIIDELKCINELT